MPDDPNSNIEEQLKAWARKRRQEAGASLELHSATRRLLQDEVARTHANHPEKPERKFAGLAWLWPRFAVALPVVAVVAVMLALLVPSLSKPKSKGQQTFEVAQQSKRVSVEEFERSDAANRGKLGESVSLRDEATRMPALSAGPAPTVLPPAQTPALAGDRSYAYEKSKDSLGIKLEAGREVESDARKNAELAFAENAKEAAPPLAQAAPTTRGLAADNEQSELARQRYGLAATQPARSEESVGRRLRSASVAQQSEAKAAAGSVTGGKDLLERQVALNQTTRGGGSGGAGGAALPNKRDTGVVPALPEQGGPATDRFALALKPAEERAATVPAVSLGERAQAGRQETANIVAFYARADAQLTQRFAQARNYRRNFNSPPTPDVLNSFQLEQNGQQIRIVDADGSTYEGQIEGLKAQPAVLAKLVTETPAVELKKAQPEEADQARSTAFQNSAANAPGQSVWFRVAGTNRTLNQPVVFLGNLLIADTNALNSVSIDGVQAGATIAPLSSTPAQNALLQNQLLLQNTRVQGQATIGAGNRIEINAVPVEP